MDDLHDAAAKLTETFSKALAQKVTIRLSTQYTSAKLVEINCGDLFSKWFGESSKLVGEVFKKIHELAEDSDTLVCVLIDEVESIAASRARSTKNNECGDAVRVGPLSHCSLVFPVE